MVSEGKNEIVNFRVIFISLYFYLLNIFEKKKLNKSKITIVL